ncbi:hypothetical protein [Desulfonema magnum]|uniref:Uncharacterized protein n=1 Tax=Desulfonema magnum TaxID=45655 RepID=A0A975BL48_9BACT|nr:hypothetical protein [Desulfonema magnum]QTA87440.1 Uncharacterized protein dnm_034740 [Desulfonema magnum]
MNEKMTITLASVPDREGLVAELWYDNEQWGEIFQEQNELRLALYPNPNHTFWVFSAEDAANAIREAKNKLLGTGPDNETPDLEADAA